MPKVKSEGWESKCELILDSKRSLEAHNKICETCKVKRKRRGQGGYFTRCGLEFKSFNERLVHRKRCDQCRPAQAFRVGAIPTIFKSRCGLEFYGRRKMKLHQSDCDNCLLIKKENIKLRQLKHNQSQEQRLASSQSAINTSKRPDILLKRTENLKKWREENPEALDAIFRSGQLSSKKSKLEMWVKNNLLKDGWSPQRIECNQDRKYVDFVNGKIWIEIDGPFHFYEMFHSRPLKNVQTRDELLKNECLRRQDVTLIHIDFKCFHRTGRMKDEWQQIFMQMLRLNQPGVWCLGELYELTPWAKDGCMILKSPIPNIISVYQTV